MPTSPRVRYKGRGRTGGEIGEAPPVADAARRFRGSAPIGGRDSGRESVGTTVGKRIPPLRKRNKECGEAGDHKGRPYGGFPDRISQGFPTPFLHISCSLCVDSLWINFPSPFLPPFCGNSSFPLWKKNPCISRPYGGFPQKFSLRLLLLKNT